MLQPFLGHCSLSIPPEIYFYTLWTLIWNGLTKFHVDVKFGQVIWQKTCWRKLTIRVFDIFYSWHEHDIIKHEKKSIQYHPKRIQWQILYVDGRLKKKKIFQYLFTKTIFTWDIDFITMYFLQLYFRYKFSWKIRT